MISWIRRAVATALLALTTCSNFATPAKAQDVPAWPANSVIYSIYTSIFSPAGNFAGITAQLGRLKKLGVMDIWIMPVTPTGKAINGHPSVNSPYSVHDYYAVNPDYGTADDLHDLIAKAHAMGLRILLDQVLNHTSWDNALITQHPEFYVHSDSNVKDPNTIKMAFNYADVAQLDYANPDLRSYMIQMLKYWITEYHVDGFRFDSADNPDGPGRKVPADFWQQLGTQLRQTKPDVLMLEEGETPDLARKPFSLDYAWRMYDPGGHGALKSASDGGDASQVETAWQFQVSNFPVGMQHMSVQDDWDTPRDVNSFGGPAGALAVAAFNLTNTGIPLIYNGMEIGNSAEATNPHAPIKWSNVNPEFPTFYRQMIALRYKYPAFRTGSMTWLPNTVAGQVLTYERAGDGRQFLVEVNVSNGPAKGTVTTDAGAKWTPVPITGVETAGSLEAPPTITLQPKGFAIFQRALPKS